MAKEYKTLTFIDSPSGRQKMAEVVNQLAADGWKVHSKETAQQNYSFVNTCCLGCIFLPLALLGKKKSIITVMLERDIDPNRKDENEGADLNSQTITDYSSKPWYKKWWVYVIIIFFGIPVLSGIIGGFSRINSTKNTPINNQTTTEQTKTADDSDELDVTVSHDSSVIVIKSNETKNLTGCGFTLNQNYNYGSGDEYLIEANSTVKLNFSDFTKNDGTRFNVYVTKPQYLSFHCNRVGGTSGFADLWWN